LIVPVELPNVIEAMVPETFTVLALPSEAPPSSVTWMVEPLLLATTLLHRTGLLNPYAARGDGEVRVTSVSRDAHSFWRLLPRLLTGRYLKSMSADNGYLSGRCDSVRVDGLAGYSLDGEAFDTDPSRPVVISAGPRLRFIRP
jgi:hypothetical protein